MNLVIVYFQIALVTEAVKLDQALNYAEAVEMYCQALDYFVPALQCKWLPKFGLDLKDEMPDL